MGFKLDIWDFITFATIPRTSELTLVKKDSALWRKISVFEVKWISLRAQPWCGSARGSNSTRRASRFAIPAPRVSHADWKPPADRPDPIQILEASNEGRFPELIPFRYGRMIPSPFVFFRGAAAIMAADLAHTPATGIGPSLW